MRLFGRNFPKGSRQRAIKVVETFLAEAAVLLAVFPILDEFIQRGLEGVTLKLAVVSVGGASLLLAVAILLAVTTQEGDEG